MPFVIDCALKYKGTAVDPAEVLTRNRIGVPEAVDGDDSPIVRPVLFVVVSFQFQACALSPLLIVLAPVAPVKAEKLVDPPPPPPPGEKHWIPDAMPKALAPKPPPLSEPVVQVPSGT